MLRVRRQPVADVLVALRAQRVVRRSQLRVPVDVGLVGIAVARRARRAAAQKAFALPQADRIVREAARASVGPVRRVATGATWYSSTGWK